MRIKIIISVGILIIIFFGKGISQGLLKDVELSFGYAFQPQDRRLFDFPQQEALIYNETSHHDFQYDFLFSKNYFTEHNFNIAIGLGYSVFISRFSRPFDHNYFTHDFTKPLFIIGIYTTNSLKLETTLKYKLIGRDKSVLSFVIPSSLNYSFNKTVKRSEWRRDRWNFEFNKIEIYSGLEYRNGKISMRVSYRIFNLQEIDQVIFNHILFGGIHSDFLDSKTETLNLDKIMFCAGYQF